MASLFAWIGANSDSDTQTLEKKLREDDLDIYLIADVENILGMDLDKTVFMYHFDMLWNL